MNYKEIEERELKVTIPIATNYLDCWELIKSDAIRHNVSGGGGIFKLLLRNSGFAFLFYYRLSCVRGFFYPFARFMKYRIGKKYGIQISHNTIVGYGLYFQHPYGVILHESTIIGNNCTISQFVTFGSMVKSAAVCGDNVYIGPNSCIVENVIIGSDSVIGAGAVVVKDVPENCTVAGCPAKIVSRNNSDRYIVNRYPFDKYTLR